MKSIRRLLLFVWLISLVRRHSFVYLWALLFCGLAIGCTALERQEISPTAVPIILTGTPVVPEATPVAKLPSRTPSMRGGIPPSSPIQFEPTATTPPTPKPTRTPKPTPTPMPMSTEVEGWLTYVNKFLGYRLSFPSEARITTLGMTGPVDPDEEPPEGMTSEEFLTYLELGYLDDLCVGVDYKTGFVTVNVVEPLDLHVTPCGITGIGDYTIENFEEVVLIDGQPYTASGLRLYIWETDLLVDEFYILKINGIHDKVLRIDFGLNIADPLKGTPQLLTQEESDEVREILFRVVESLRFQE